LVQATEIRTKDFEFGRVVLLSSLPSDHLHVRSIDPVDSTEAYSDFMAKRLNFYVETICVLTI